MTASPSLGPLSNDVIDERYTIERQLGEGGMGSVFLARHNVTGRRVALKWVQSNDKSLRQRLLREARAIAKVTHPSVVDVLDAGEHGAGVYIVLPYLSGKNLRDHVGARRLGPNEAVQLLMPALEGVAAAHLAGILHRDLKPENLYVCIDAEGAVFDTKVLDFGVAKHVLGPAEQKPKLTALTQEGHIVGTPEYMAPEQISHAPVLDERTDVYAMGLVLYELLTGRLPYETRELRALLLDIVRGELPSPSRFREELPGELCRVVMKALANDPAQRYESIAAFARALEPYAAGRVFEPPRKISGERDAGVHVVKTVHRSGAVPVEPSRTERASDEPQPTREQRSLKPKPKPRPSAEPLEAAHAASMHSGVSVAPTPLSSEAPSIPTRSELRTGVIAALVLLVAAAVGYVWLRPTSEPVERVPVTKVAPPVEPAAPEPAAAQALEPAAPVAEPAPALAAEPSAPPAIEPVAPERAVRSTSRSRKAGRTAAETAPKAVEVKTRAGTFGAKDF